MLERREECLMMGSEWPLSAEISWVDSANTFTMILSLCFLFIHCALHDRGKSRGPGIWKFSDVSP